MSRRDPGVLRKLQHSSDETAASARTAMFRSVLSAEEFVASWRGGRMAPAELTRTRIHAIRASAGHCTRD